MEVQNNIPVLAKKVWRLVRVLYLMLRKNVSKSKLLLDLNKMMKRRRNIAGKSTKNLMSPAAAAGEYEFSCSNSPSTNYNHFSLFPFHKKHHPHTADPDTMAVNAAMLKAMEMIHSETASPALPGFGRSPMVVRQLRVTDSPFPLSSVDEDSHVDEAADQFISRFYDDLRRQNTQRLMPRIQAEN